LRPPAFAPGRAGRCSLSAGTESTALLGLRSMSGTKRSLGRIVFVGSPWPEGHRIETFDWRGSLDTDGALRFHLHLQTADYNAERDVDTRDTEVGDWASSGVWCNYDRCTLSSDEWGACGFPVATASDPLDLERLHERTFIVDPPPIDLRQHHDRAGFHIYLLGHDDVADHHINFAIGERPGVFAVSWRGRIALTYGGQSEFKYAFEAMIPSARLERITVCSEMGDDIVVDDLAACLVQADRYRLIHTGKRREFVLRDA